MEVLFKGCNQGGLSIIYGLFLHIDVSLESSQLEETIPSVDSDQPTGNYCLRKEVPSLAGLSRTNNLSVYPLPEAAVGVG